MRMSQLHPSKWLTADDLNDEDKVVTIKSVELEEVGQDRQSKPVIFFHELAKGMVGNVTNCQIIAKLHGQDTDDWLGKRITLYPTEVQFNKEMVSAIRVRSKPPKDIKPPKGNKPVVTQAEIDADNGESEIPF